VGQSRANTYPSTVCMVQQRQVSLASFESWCFLSASHVYELGLAFVFAFGFVACWLPWAAGQMHAFASCLVESSFFSGAWNELRVRYVHHHALLCPSPV
jgi:hypothetical protein